MVIINTVSSSLVVFDLSKKTVFISLLLLGVGQSVLKASVV